MALADEIIVMNDGMVEQAGPPRDVFNQPASEFVARFIGGHNVLSTPAGPVAIRSDRIRLTPHDGSVPSQLSGTIHDVSFLGSVVSVAIKSADDDELTVSVSDAEFANHPFDLGQSVALQWSDNDVHRLAT